MNTGVNRKITVVGTHSAPVQRRFVQRLSQRSTATRHQTLDLGNNRGTIGIEVADVMNDATTLGIVKSHDADVDVFDGIQEVACDRFENVHLGHIDRNRIFLPVQVVAVIDCIDLCRIAAAPGEFEVRIRRPLARTCGGVGKNVAGTVSMCPGVVLAFDLIRVVANLQLLPAG